MSRPDTSTTLVSSIGGEGLAIKANRRGEVTLLRLEGDLDLRTAPRLRVELSDLVRRSEGDVAIDLSDVAFIDSTGLAALLNALRRLTRANRRMVIVCSEGPVMRILRLTRLDGTFEIADDIESALETLD